ncbi:MAG: hypothetical protein RI883_1933 [Bacteroidota bacterium]|jgi:hypothetical protein
MKNLLFIIASSFSLSGITQTVIHWEPEIFVTDATTFGNTRPRITLAANDIPVVIFGKSSTGLLYTARLNGSSFDTPVTLLPGTVSSYLTTWTGPDIASKGDTVIAVFKAMTMDDGKVYAVRSINGGITFSDTIRVDNHDSGLAWMPSLDMDENGNPSIVYMAHDASMTNPRYNVVHSIDQGITYQPEMEITLSIPEEACDCCPAEYVIDGSQHALLYRNNDVNIRDIYAVYSNDDGMTFPEYANVEELNWFVNSCPSSGPHGMFNNGKLITVSASRASGQYRAYISETSTSPSLAIQSITMMTPPTNVNGSQNYPRITGVNDTIVMVWQEAETSNTEIYAGITTTGTISEIINSKSLVNDSVQGAQTNPDIVYANGKVHCVFQDGTSGKVIYKRGIIGTLSTNALNSIPITIYPNPSKTGVFYINSSAETLNNTSVTNAIGQKCDFKIVKDGTQSILILDKATKGEYFLSFEINGLKETRVLIVE